MQAAGFQNVYALNGNVEDQIGFGTFDEKNENKVYWFGDKLHELNVPYPVTKLVCCRQMMATVSDMLRLYSVRDGIVLERELTKTEPSGPITSMDWNKIDTGIVGTCSVDTTCTIWDINEGKATTQLIAHDAQVFDISFGNDVHSMASVGADGSLRTFDLRCLDSSTILYESVDLCPLARLAWNRLNTHLIGTIMVDKPNIIVLDTRKPSTPWMEWSAHTFGVNSIDWSPISTYELCSTGESSTLKTWEVQGSETPTREVEVKGSVNNAVYLPNGQIAMAWENHVDIIPCTLEKVI